ncbi:hypothetical protein AMAG_19292 [Allomyces macrogynus ATCC 38327]|uniref:Uncharacterized protein n=1 Tax=Allomyces macrogynus (strain ATCC 38327) TaxID=578462 RepID=A0A0L0SQP6_ALLM3|nr:hypothetical protein AMAG_19292 [Allomyces macrogynus ATCC 38327]|eukprot:KNE64863.1 hypothetical protein AMAG_19292 [Allomyces macrogynus ATCC 38327]
MVSPPGCCGALGVTRSQQVETRRPSTLISSVLRGSRSGRPVRVNLPRRVHAEARPLRTASQRVILSTPAGLDLAHSFALSADLVPVGCQSHHRNVCARRYASRARPRAPAGQPPLLARSHR